MLYSKSNLPLFLWAEAMNTTVHVINKTGLTRQDKKTPYELWYGKSPDVEKFRVFGTECFAHIPAEHSCSGSRGGRTCLDGRPLQV